jgi:hypothetical protein
VLKLEYRQKGWKTKDVSGQFGEHLKVFDRSTFLRRSLVISGFFKDEAYHVSARAGPVHS